MNTAFLRIRFLVNGVIFKIRDHDEDVILSALCTSLGQQHVLWPSTSAELE